MTDLTPRELEPTRAEILETVEKMAEEVRVNPTNAELLETIERGANVFKAHADEDKTNFDAIHARMDTLATKEDIREVLEVMKSLNIVIGGFKFTFNNAAKIGAFIVLVGGVFYATKLFGVALWLALTGKQ
jgi:hypothetical protein